MTTGRASRAKREDKDSTLTYEELGVDALFVDEAGAAATRPMIDISGPVWIMGRHVVAVAASAATATPTEWRALIDHQSVEQLSAIEERDEYTVVRDTDERGNAARTGGVR